MSIGGCRIAEYAFKKKIHILVNAQSATLRPKGAQTPHNWHISPNCWQNISNIRIYPQFLAEYILHWIKALEVEVWGPGLLTTQKRIYLIPEHIQYQYTYIFNYSYIPNCWLYIYNTYIFNTICRGPIHWSPICHQGAQSAGARFAGAQSAGAQFAGARFATNKISGAQSAGAQFAIN